MPSARPIDLEYYAGLVFKTSQMYERVLDMDREDIQQILQIKVWRSLEAFDATRSSVPVERYVFGCVRNQVKDLVKARFRRLKWGSETYIEDEARNSDGSWKASFELEHLSVELELEEVGLPSTLTSDERHVVALLYVGYKQTEIAGLLEVDRRDVTRSLRSVRTKMDHLRPEALAAA